MKIKKLLLVLALLVPGLLSADNISEQRARIVAEKFFSSARSATRASSVSLRMIWDGEDGMTKAGAQPAFYVYNNVAGKGFVIVAGDDCVETPILGYSFNQNFDAENMPYNLKTWMNGIRSDIQHLMSCGVQPSASARSAWAKAGLGNISRNGINDKTPIVLLDTPLWDQRRPYNDKLPLGFVTGCPATAISIIMRYHKWPDKGVGTIPQYDDRLPAITLGHTYDWDNMPYNYNGASEYQNNQVAVLMRDVGCMIRTQYGGGTAGARPEETLPQLMPIYMRYNKSTIKSYLKRDFDDARWHEILKKELNEKRPVLYGGYSSGGGHQFVLDGYAEGNYYHVNWGWSGVSNGYYLLTGMNPPEQGAGGSSSADGFTQKQDAIIGIQPDKSNPGGGFFDLISFKQYNSVRDLPYGLMTEQKEFVVGQAFKVDIKEFQNKGSRDFNGKIAVGHFGADGKFKGIISSKEINYQFYPIAINEFTEASLQCTISSAIEPGDRICAVFKHINPSDWTIIRNGYPEKTNCTEEIVIMEGDITPEPEPEPTNDLDHHVSLKFNSVDKVLTLTFESIDSVQVKLIDASGKDCPSDIISLTETNCNINCTSLSGDYTLKLTSPTRGDYHCTVVF